MIDPYVLEGKPETLVSGQTSTKGVLEARTITGFNRGPLGCQLTFRSGL